MDEPTEIPQFDLAEQIMAAHRKTAATRRKGPGKKTVAEKREAPEPAAHILVPTMLSSDRGGIIAEIVARDIRQLCSGHASGLGR